MRRLLLTTAAAALLAPTVFAQENVFLRQERGTDSPEIQAATQDVLGVPSPNGIELPALVIPGTQAGDNEPTEPLGCTSTVGGTSCWDFTATNHDNVYGWPKALTYPDLTNDPNDSYYISVNFWNNEAVLGDATPYPPGTINEPGTRSTYPADSPQYVLPAGGFPNSFSPYLPENEYRPVAPFVAGVLEAEVYDPTWTVKPFLFRITDSTATSRSAANELIDERYYPASYPTIFKGCHTTNCTEPSSGGQGGAPFPIQVQDLGNIPSNWQVSIGEPTLSNGVYDVAYDIWLDIGRRPADCRKHCLFYPWATGTKADDLPEGNKFVMQPYGTEIMIWVGYSDGNDPEGVAGEGGLVQPAGRKIATRTVNGQTWDVWVGYGRDTTDTSLYWNIVSFIRHPDTGYDNSASSLTFNMDTQPFIAQVLSLDGTTTGENGYLGCPIGYVNNYSNPPTFETGATGPAETVNSQPCAAPDWWLTDIDAGFEIWDEGEGMQTTAFTVHPTFNKPVSSERITDDGTNRVLINWMKHFQLAQDPALWAAKGIAACNGTVTYDLESEDSFQTVDNGATITWCPGIGRWYSSSATKAAACDAGLTPNANHVAMANPYGDNWYALNSSTMWDKGMHGNLTVHFYCDGTEFNSESIYIDPSGRVLQVSADGTETSPLLGAQVTLHRQDGAGNWYVVANGDESIMDPKVNTTNPDVSAYDGAFGWDVAPGTYKVSAQKNGCHAPGNPDQLVVETEVLPVPPPYFNLELLLECPGPDEPPVNTLPVDIQIFNSWDTGGPYGTGGYCANLLVTNDTSQPVDWNVTFTLPESGDIYTTWNADYQQSGDTVTADGFGWISILQPGQTTNSVGFCVNRGPGGGGTIPLSPCDGLCANPISFPGPYHQGINLGSGAVCYETMATLSGGNCGNFAGGRTLSVNGQVMSCNSGNWSALPAPRAGGYCFSTTPGQYPWAYFTTW